MPDLEGAVLDAPEVDTGADVDTGTEVDTEVTDPDTEGTEPSTETTDEPDGDQTDAEGEQEGQEDADADAAAQTEGKQDGRTIPDSLKKAIAAIKATNPAAAKEIKGLYYSNQAYREVFPKPEDAVAAKTLMDEVGGAEGLQAIHSEREEWANIDRAFLEGSKDFYHELAESNTDAFVKGMPHAINEFAQRAPEQYGYYANTVALNTFKNAGIDLPTLAAAHARYANNPEAQAIIAEIHNSLLGLKQQAHDFEQKRHDPREEQLKQRETEFEQRRRADFEGAVANDAEKYLSDKMQPEIARYIPQGQNVDPEAQQILQGQVLAEVQRRLGEIPGFGDRLEAFYRTGDKQKSLDYIKTQYNRILPEAAKKIVTPFFRNIAPKPAQQAHRGTARPTNGQRPASPGEVVLKEMPEWKDVDQTRTTVADIMEGHAILKNGKRATGWV